MDPDDSVDESLEDTRVSMAVLEDVIASEFALILMSFTVDVILLTTVSLPDPSALISSAPIVADDAVVPVLLFRLACFSVIVVVIVVMEVSMVVIKEVSVVTYVDFSTTVLAEYDMIVRDRIMTFPFWLVRMSVSFNSSINSLMTPMKTAPVITPLLSVSVDTDVMDVTVFCRASLFMTSTLRFAH